MENLSDGISDGFVLFYIKDKKLNTVLLNEEQAQTLDMMLNVVFKDTPARVMPSDDVAKYLPKESE